MEWFEKEYKHRFKNETTSEGVESDLLWANISSSIPQKSPKKKAPIWRITLIIGILLVLGSSLYLINDWDGESSINTAHSEFPETTKNQIEAGSTKEVNTEISSMEVDDLTSTEDTNLTDRNDEGRNYNVANESSQNAIQMTEQNTFTPLSTELNGSEIKEDNSRSEKEESTTSYQAASIIAQSDDAQKSEVSVVPDIPGSQSNESNSTEASISTSDQYINRIASTPSSTSDLYVNESTSEAEEELMSLTNEKDEVSPTTGIVDSKSISVPVHISSISLSSLGYDRPLIAPEIKQIELVQQTSSPWSIALHSSANFMDLSYSELGNAEAFAAEANASLGSLQVGNSTGLRLEYAINSNWMLTTGIDFSTFETKLDVVLTSELMQLDTLQAIRNVRQIRTVRHHNKLSILTIPVQLTYSVELTRKSKLGARLGLNYSIVAAQSGRLLGRNNTIIDYSGTENTQFNNFLSYSFSPFFRYGLTERLSLDLTAGISFQNHSNSEVLDLGQRSKMYNLGVGVVYGF